MRIAVIGTGYVGLVSGACFSEFGVEVICVDQDAAKVARLRRGEMPIYEPGLEALVAANTAAGRLSFTTELGPAVVGADAVFIAVGTPSRRGDGHADLTHVFAAAEEIGRALATRPSDHTVVVTKSTVPVGTGRQVASILRGACPPGNFDVASNPEFLREGSAIEDFLRPDRVVIGADSEPARQVMRQLYRPLYLIETPMLFTDIETAELIKYAANAFLAAKITFINEIADLCERVGGDVQDVARGIGLDGRIGRKFLHVGPGFGGSCFPKDCTALMRTAATSAGSSSKSIPRASFSSGSLVADKAFSRSYDPTLQGRVTPKTSVVSPDNQEAAFVRDHRLVLRPLCTEEDEEDEEDEGSKATGRLPPDPRLRFSRQHAPQHQTRGDPPLARGP
jgi:UDPglucose 6-dehydrogenase